MMYSFGSLLLNNLIAASTFAFRSRKQKILPNFFFSPSIRFVRLKACNRP